MKVVVVGAGALGSIVGGHLVRAGHDVVFVARAARARTLREQGVVLTGLADLRVPAVVADDARAVSAADLLVLTVKTYDTEAALADVRHLDVATVLSLQNGVAKNDHLAGGFGRTAVIGAAATVAGELLPDGVVRFTLNDNLTVGELPSGTSPRVVALVSALRDAGLNAAASAHIRTVEWSKYALFVSGMAVASLTRLPTGKFLADPDGARIVAQLIQEVGLIADRLGIPLQDGGLLPIKTLSAASCDDAVARLREAGSTLSARAPAHKISTLQDLERGRRLELEDTVGYAVRRAAELGVAVPTIDTCYRLLAGINRHLT